MYGGLRSHSPVSPSPSSADPASPHCCAPVQDQLRQKYPCLKEDLTVDVIVVGAGLEGLCVAYQLAKAGGGLAGLDGWMAGCSELSWGACSRAAGVRGAVSHPCSAAAGWR